MFWNWIRSLISNNSFVQQFTNHYYQQRTDNETSQSTTQNDRYEYLDNMKYNSKDDSKTINSKNNSRTNLRNECQIDSATNLQNSQTKAQKLNQSINSKMNTKSCAGNISIGRGNGNKKKQKVQEENQIIDSMKNKSMNNQLDNGTSGACLENLNVNIRKLLNFNSDLDDNLLLNNQKSKPNESFYQTWLAEYRSMQLKGKQKLADKVDQVKESLNQMKENKKENSDSKEQNINQLRNLKKSTLNETNSRTDQVLDQSMDCKLIKNKLIDQNLIDLPVQSGQQQTTNEQQIKEQMFEQIIGRVNNEEFKVENLIKNKNDDKNQQSSFNLTTALQQLKNNTQLQNCKINLSINSELMNQMQVTQAQSYHQQLNVSGGITPIYTFRSQAKRSSYPSGLRSTPLRIGPRLNRDKSRSRLVE